MRDIAADASRDGRAEGESEPAREQGGSDVAFSGDSALPDAYDTEWGGESGQQSRGSTPTGSSEVDWGKYEPAVKRWEAITGEPAPSPTEFGPRGNVRLSPRFAEWMMGVPPGWITGHGFTRKDMFRLIGNGVVPLQAALAIGGLMDEYHLHGNVFPLDGRNGGSEGGFRRAA